MNKEIELHDSTLSEIAKSKSEVTLLLDKAIIHHSEGKPGIHKGTCWRQALKMIFSDATILNIPKKIPIDISEGELIIGNVEYSNMFELFTNISGEIEFKLLTGYNERLNIKAKELGIITIGNEEYLQEFLGL